MTPPRKTDDTSGPTALASVTAAASADGSPAYRPPDGPEDDHWLALGIKVGAAMFIANVLARALGFEDPTWSVISAAFVATSPPLESVRAALKRLVAVAVGVVLGAAGAWASQLLAGVPALHFALVGLVAGVLGTRSSTYLFAAVVGTIITFAGTGGNDPLPEVVTTTACMVALGCLVGPAVVWCVERTRRALAERGT